VKAAAINGLKITGTPGVIVPAGFKIATPADNATNTPSVEFVTTNECILDGQGIGYANIEAVDGGVSGNVGAGAISIIVSDLNGVTSVTNPEPITGGLDIEDDLSLLTRYLQRVRNPSSSGNRADYIAWALEVPGVGAVSVIPVRDGPGTVSVAILNSNMEPADQNLIDIVQNYIAPPWILTKDAEEMSLGDLGVSIDETLEDDAYNSVKMVYNATGNGTITHELDTFLPQLGIWQARVSVKADQITGETNLLQIGVYNTSAGAWCKDRPFGSADAVITLKGVDLHESFQKHNVEFYWNGQDHIELRISRLTSDGATTLWVDQVTYISTFSKDTGDGKAPIGARVTVEAATAVMINISATLELVEGYNANSVKSAVTENIRAYIKSLAFVENDNDVRYVRIGEAILDTPGVYDFSNLLVNDGTVNIPIGPQEVAILGVVNLTV
jgi:uncharacterized phage protein gp47/JayE